MSYEDALKVFSLNEDFTEQEFKSSYYKLAKEKHPDTESGNQDDMTYINEAKIIIEKKLKQDSVNNLKEKFKQEINKIKTKYQNNEIINVCDIYNQNIDAINNLVDLENERKKFYTIIDKLKREVILPILKKEQESWLLKKEKGHENDIKELINKYIDINKNAKSIEELNSIKQKFTFIYNKLLDDEKVKIKDFISFKDKIKRSLIYHFYKYSCDSSISIIIIRYELLLSMLSLLELSNINNIENIYNIIKDVNYDNPKEEMSKIKLLLLEFNHNKDIKYEDFVSNNKITKNTLNIPLEKEKAELVNRMLESFYTMCTNKNMSIDKIFKDKDKFIDLMNTINKSSVDTITKALNYKENNWKRYKMILESVDDFLDPSKIYIERETGNICVLKEYNNKVYSIYLNGEIEKSIDNKNGIIWKYISLYNFFRVSYFTEGKAVMEVSNKNEIVLFDYNSNDLYFTSDLLLRYIDDDSELSFEFYPVKNKYKYVLSNNSQVTKNNYFDEFKARDKCLMELPLFIKNKQNEEINKKNFDILNKI